MAYYTHTHTHTYRSWKPLWLYLGLMFCPHYSQSSSTLTNSTCWAGCCSSPAVQITGSSKADFIFVNDRCVNVHLCSHRLFHFYLGSSFSFSRIRVVRDVVSWYRSLLLCKNILANLVSLSLLFSTSYFVCCPICCMGRGWHWWTACSRLCLSRTVGMYR